MASRSTRHAATPSVARCHAHDRPQRSRTPFHMPPPSSSTPHALTLVPRLERALDSEPRPAFPRKKQDSMAGLFHPDGPEKNSLVGATMARHSACVVVRPSLVNGHADRSLRAPGYFSDQHLFVGDSVRSDQKEPVLWTAPLARIRKATWSAICVRARAMTIAPRRARKLPQIPRRHHR